MTERGNRARIAFIAPRYGRSVVGGAETLCRLLAENLSAHGTAVDVLSTCATDHTTWRNVLPEGETAEAGVRVRRFAVGARDGRTFGALHSAIEHGVHLSYRDQVAWMANSAWAPGMIEAAHQYDWVVAMPYLFGTSFWQVVADPDRTVLIPCLHDEPHARQSVVLDSLCSARGLMLNAPGERDLVNELLAGHRGGTARLRNDPSIVGCGFDETPLPSTAEASAFAARHGVECGYILYAGRREHGKGVADMYAHYRRYREVSPNPRPLALMGSGDLAPPADIAPHVVDLGFVDINDRAAAYAAAGVLVQPSRLESFGMVLFESWLAGTPVLVNARSTVLRRHCEVSGGGLWFGDAATFAEGLDLILEAPEVRASLAAAGREYTLTDFRWSAVRDRFHSALEAWA